MIHEPLPLPDYGDNQWSEELTVKPEISLRDYFAGLAMQAQIQTRHPHYSGDGGPDIVAQDAYMVADAMLHERENHSGSTDEKEPNVTDV